jgi:bifunctional DNase/RNase
MIDVRVGSIDRHPVTGAPLVSLEPHDTRLRARLMLPLSPAAACSLSHELEGQTTLRAMVYALLSHVADTLGGQITAVEIVPAPNEMAAGHLCVCGPDSSTLIPVEITLGIGLAVVLGVPLRVDDRLVQTKSRTGLPVNRPAAAPDVSPPAPAPLDIPAAFHRAFGDGDAYGRPLP